MMETPTTESELKTISEEQKLYRNIMCFHRLTTNHFYPNLIQIFDFRLVFMMGTPTTESELKTISEEQKLYGDIVQGSFTEHYTNLTLKAIMGLKWVSEYCSNAPYAIKVSKHPILV